MGAEQIKILQLVDVNGYIVRQETYIGGKSRESIKERWKRLYANNKAYRSATYNIIDGNYATIKKNKK